MFDLEVSYQKLFFISIMIFIILYFCLYLVYYKYKIKYTNDNILLSYLDMTPLLKEYEQIHTNRNFDNTDQYEKLIPFRNKTNPNIIVYLKEEKFLAYLSKSKEIKAYNSKKIKEGAWAFHLAYSIIIILLCILGLSLT